uniref:Uncharacterized protein n=1 Tax=Branchiostoma floridae TaxID=7739 RepID=C3ZUH5_BRAFL|eukprot:XP_002587803.1 hypothetical protein BRAFLDRAFT_126585 [Branchiostoma floridae]
MRRITVFKTIRTYLRDTDIPADVIQGLSVYDFRAGSVIADFVVNVLKSSGLSDEEVHQKLQEAMDRDPSLGDELGVDESTLLESPVGLPLPITTLSPPAYTRTRPPSLYLPRRARGVQESSMPKGSTLTRPPGGLLTKRTIEDRHGRVQPVDPIAVLGSTVTFNCTIRPEEDGVTARRVYWRHETETIAAEKYRALSDTISQLVLENVSPESAGRYECYVPEPTNRACGPLVGGVKLNTGYAPEEPVLDRCLSENLDLFTCWWYKGRDTLIKTEYSIVYKHYHVGNLHFRLNITAQNQLGRAESVNLVNPINYDSDHVYFPDHTVKPAPVRNLRVIGRRSTSVSLSWSNPASLSHFALLYQAWYRSEWDSTMKYVNLSQTTHGDLTDLSPFTTYDICVRAHPVQLDASTGDIIGTEGYWSDCPELLISVQTHKAPPVGTVPAWLHVTPSSHPGIRNVIVYWKELPQRDQNGVIKDYTVAVASRAENGHITQESYRLLTVSGDKRHVNLTSALQLKSDTSYVIKVYASNELGRSQDTVLQLPQDGEVPTIQASTINVNVTSPTSVTLSWQQPEETRVQLTGYIIFWMAWKSENGMYTWGEPDWQSVVDDQVLARTMAQHEVSRGLEGRTRYRFGIVLISREGFGETTVINAYTEEMAPRGQVEDLHLSTSGPTSLQLTWEPLPLEWRGGILQGYQVQYCPLVEGIGTACAEGSTKTVNITGEETASLILRGLSPFTRYTVRIAAVNRQGLGQFSDASVQITAESEGSTKTVNITGEETASLILRGLSPFTRYTVNSDVHQLVDVDTIPVYGNTNYTVRLQACTTAGCGPFSSSHSVTTPIVFVTVTLTSHPVTLSLHLSVSFSFTVCNCNLNFPSSHSVTTPIGVCNSNLNFSSSHSVTTPIAAPEAPPLPIVSEFKSSPSTVHLRPVTPAHPNGPIDHYLVSYMQKDDQGRSQPLVQRVEGTAEAVVEVDCTENKAVLYEFWVQAVNRDEEGKLLPGDPSERLERQMCLVPVVRVDGIPVAIVIPVVAGIISIILVTSLVWKNRHRVKRKLFPKVPGPVLFLEEDGPYSALYVVTATNKHEPETCDDISDFLREGGEVSLLTDGCDQLNNKDSKEARRSAPKTPLGSMSYVSRQEDSSPPSVNGVSQTPECHSPTGNLEMTSLWDVEKTPCNKDQTKSPAAYVRVVPEGEEEFYCVTGTLLDKTLPESGTPVKRKLFPKVPGPVLFLEEDGPYSALYVVTATNKHEPETCDDISDFLREGGEVSLLTDGCDQLNNKDSKEARRSAPKTPLGSMSYVSRQEDSSPPSVNGVSQTPECHSPTGNLEMTSLWDVEKTPCNKDQTKSPAAYVRVVPEGEEEFYCVTGTLLDKTLPESGTPYVTNLPSPSPNNGENVDPKPEADFYCVTGTFHDGTSPRLTGQQASPVPNVPYVTNIPSPPCSGHSVGSEPDSKEHFGYQARHSLESPCEEKEVLSSNQEGGEGCCHGDQGHHPDKELQSLNLNLDGYVQRSLPDGTSVTKMPDNVSPTFAPYTPH